MSNQYFGDDRIVHEYIDVSKASSRRIYPNSEVSDDIVTRLRHHHCFDDAGCNSITQDAADEIERLRAEVARLGSFLHPIGTIMDGKAVRGE